MIKAGIVGGTGYTGIELLRLLAQHPQVELRAITSRKEAGTPVAAMFPSLRGRVDLAFSAPDAGALRGCDVVFFATPHGVAMQEAGALLDAGAKVIDLSADFRMQDLAEWERWYKVKHAAPELVAQAVYGLCEVNRDKIRGARLVANPGCYPTAVQLGLLPLVEAGVVDVEHLIADAKSGVSGAGRKLEQKKYYRYSGYPGGLRIRTMRELMETKPEDVVYRAVKGMMPNTRLGRQQLRKLRVYPGGEHRQQAQTPQPVANPT